MKSASKRQTDQQTATWRRKWRKGYGRTVGQLLIFFSGAIFLFSQQNGLMTFDRTESIWVGVILIAAGGSLLEDGRRYWPFALLTTTAAAALCFLRLFTAVGHWPAFALHLLLTVVLFASALLIAHDHQ